MDRRLFLQTATLAAGGAALTGAESQPAAAQGAATAARAAHASGQHEAVAQARGAASNDRWANRAPKGAPVMRRFNEQEWLLDHVIATRGIDWDQGRTTSLLRACGDDIRGDMEGLKRRVTRLVEIAPAFEDLAREREARAVAAERAGDKAIASANFYIAAQYWASAMWPIDEADEQLRRYNDKKRETFSRYMALADHRVEWAEIPYRGTHLPAVFHLPPGYQSGAKVPVIVAVPGMDGYKERSVGIAADAWMRNGFAVLALEGPGYWEAPLRGLYVDVPGWAEAGKTAMEWLLARPEVDGGKIGVTGSSFGSFFSAILISDEPRYKACAITGTCYEPGGETIFNHASPTFKRRFMFMSGLTDEAEFDEFRKTIDWHGYAERIRAPYLVASGEFDQLCPLEYTESFVQALGGPKQLVIYQGGNHSLTGSPAAVKGPEPRRYQAEWMMARLSGQPMQSERWRVTHDGTVDKTPIA